MFEVFLLQENTGISGEATTTAANAANAVNLNLNNGQFQAIVISNKGSADLHFWFDTAEVTRDALITDPHVPPGDSFGVYVPKNMTRIRTLASSGSVAWKAFPASTVRV